MSPAEPPGRGYAEVTETPGTPVTDEAADMIRTRYALGAELARGRRVLEVGAGAGIGLGMVGAEAELAVAGDVDREQLRAGRAHYGGRFPFVQLDAGALPFRDGAFGAVLLFEASYYLPELERALDEIDRVLGPEGAVAVASANPERPDFVRSPKSTRYHTADQLRRALEGRGFRVSVEAAFPLGEGGPGGRLARAARRALEALGLVPRTLEGRAALKRLVHGRLQRIPPEVDGSFGEPAPRREVGPGPITDHKVIYVTGRRG